MHGVNLSLGKRRETALQRGRSPGQRSWFAKHRFEPMTNDQIARTSSTSEDARKWPARDVSKLVLDGVEQTFEARRIRPTRGSHGIPRIAGNRLLRRRMLPCQTKWTHQQQKLRETRCEIVSPVYFKGNSLWLPKHLILPSQHHQAAVHHTAAAHHHLHAAHLHLHGKTAEAKEHSTTAHGQSETAAQYTATAHKQSQS